MKQKLWFCLCLILSLSIYGITNDTLKTKRLLGFYINLSDHYGFLPFQSNLYYKYSGGDMVYYEYERIPFSFKSPAIGLGFVIKKRKRILKADLGYFFASKKVSMVASGNGEQINGGAFSSYVDNRSFYYDPAKYFNTNYYVYSDKYIGQLYLHYLDLTLLYGRNISKNWSLIMGPRINFLLNYAYSSKLFRQASEYKIIGYGPQAGSHYDTLISVQNVTFQGKELKSVMDQTISGNFYWCIGNSFQFKIQGRTILADIMFDLNLPNKSFKKRDYIELKLGYFLDDKFFSKLKRKV